MTTETATTTSAKPAALPPTKGSLVPYLMVRDANAASKFYQKAFGAEEVSRMPVPNGTKLIHCHLYLNGHSLMMNDPMPEHGHPLEAQQGCTLTLIVDDIDAWFKRATDAGCEVVTPIATMFWGDRFAALKDPFGVSWAMNEPAA
jgi:PhnB protein